MIDIILHGVAVVSGIDVPVIWATHGAVIGVVQREGWIAIWAFLGVIAIEFNEIAEVVGGPILLRFADLDAPSVDLLLLD